MRHLFLSRYLRQTQLVRCGEVSVIAEINMSRSPSTDSQTHAYISLFLQPISQRVQDAFCTRCYANQVIELADSTRSTAEAAATVGCGVAQIARSLICSENRTRITRLRRIETDKNQWKPAQFALSASYFHSLWRANAYEYRHGKE